MRGGGISVLYEKDSGFIILFGGGSSIVYLSETHEVIHCAYQETPHHITAEENKRLIAEYETIGPPFPCV